MEGKQYLTAKEVAERYGLAYHTVLDMAEAGRLPCFRVSSKDSKFVFPVKAIEQFEKNLADVKKD